MAWRSGLFAIGAVAVVGAGVAWTQVQTPSPPATLSDAPVPNETTLSPGRLDNTTLARARQDPLTARLRGVLRQSPAAAPVLAQIDTSPVPVLGPADPGLLSAVRYYPGDRQYTLVVRRPGQIIEIFGSVRALRSPAGTTPPTSPFPTPATRRFARASAPAEAARLQAAEHRLTQIVAEQTEYGIDVAFLRFGAAYNLTFVCDAMGPPDCTEAAAIAYAASLQLLGGGGQ